MCLVGARVCNSALFSPSTRCVRALLLLLIEQAQTTRDQHHTHALTFLSLFSARAALDLAPNIRRIFSPSSAHVRVSGTNLRARKIFTVHFARARILRSLARVVSTTKRRTHEQAAELNQRAVEFAAPAVAINVGARFWLSGVLCRVFRLSSTHAFAQCALATREMMDKTRVGCNFQRRRFGMPRAQKTHSGKMRRRKPVGGSNKSLFCVCVCVMARAAMFFATATVRVR